MLSRIRLLHVIVSIALFHHLFLSLIWYLCIVGVYLYGFSVGFVESSVGLSDFSPTDLMLLMHLNGLLHNITNYSHLNQKKV